MPFDPVPQQTDEQQRIALGRAALRAIAAHILTVPALEFDLGNWQEERPTFLYLFTGRCKTVGCAVGSSYHLPEVRATGMRPAFDGGPSWADLGGWAAVQRAFALTEKQARYLFDTDEYKGHASRARVSRRINGFLATAERP